MPYLLRRAGESVKPVIERFLKAYAPRNSMRNPWCKTMGPALCRIQGRHHFILFDPLPDRVGDLRFMLSPVSVNVEVNTGKTPMRTRRLINSMSQNASPKSRHRVSKSYSPFSSTARRRINTAQVRTANRCQTWCLKRDQGGTVANISTLVIHNHGIGQRHIDLRMRLKIFIHGFERAGQILFIATVMRYARRFHPA